MRTSHHIVWAAATVATVLSVSSMLTAGPLGPPPGPVAPTPEIEPRTAVNATNTPGDTDSLFKITQPGSYYLTGNVTGVANRHGVEIAASGVTLDLMGFALVGVPGSFDGVVVSVAAVNVRIENGSAQEWGGEGVNAGNASSASFGDLLAANNGLAGLRGGGGGAVITGCVAQSNGGAGIIASAASTITGCVARSNGGAGIVASTASTVAGCVARSNGGDGFFIAGGSTIRGNTASANRGDGIETAGDSFVVNNNCDNNGFGAADGAGILVTGDDTRVEGNNATDNDRGIDIDAAGNLVIRNSAGGNGLDYTIVAGNTAGSLVAPLTIFGDTNPHANYDF